MHMHCASECGSSDKLWTWLAHKCGSYDVLLFFKVTATAILNSTNLTFSVALHCASECGSSDKIWTWSANKCVVMMYFSFSRWRPPPSWLIGFQFMSFPCKFDFVWHFNSKVTALGQFCCLSWKSPIQWESPRFGGLYPLDNILDDPFV
jgi:hypothetical protein